MGKKYTVSLSEAKDYFQLFCLISWWLLSKLTCGHHKKFYSSQWPCSNIAHGFEWQMNLSVNLFSTICLMCDLRCMISLLGVSFSFFPTLCVIFLEGIMVSISWGWCEDHYWHTKGPWYTACAQRISFLPRFLLSEVPIWLRRKENIWFSSSRTKPVDESISAKIEPCVYMWHGVEHFINF